MGNKFVPLSPGPADTPPPVFITLSTLIDSLSNFGSFFMNAIDCHDKHVTGLLNRSINSNNAIYKSVTGVLDKSISGIGVEIREGLLKDIEACVDRSMKKVQGDMITINKKEWGEFREEIVQNFEKINYDKKCHDLLVSSGEKHGGKGTGVHIVNEEQLINTVAGSQVARVKVVHIWRVFNVRGYQRGVQYWG